MPDDLTSEFVLTPEQRSRLVPNINVDSLQRFLQVVAKNAEERNAFLQFFSQTPGQNQSFQLIGPTNGDPSIMALLDEIWAPTWESWGLDAIAHSESRLPGRELARAKLMARKLPSSGE